MDSITRTGIHLILALERIVYVCMYLCMHVTALESHIVHPNIENIVENNAVETLEWTHRTNHDL